MKVAKRKAYRETQKTHNLVRSLTKLEMVKIKKKVDDINKDDLLVQSSIILVTLEEYMP